MNKMKFIGIILFLSLTSTIYVSRPQHTGPVSVNFWILLFSSQNKKSWNEAKKWCETNNNGTLAILNTAQKQNLIRRFVPAGWGRKFWIGLQSIEGDLQWVDGSPENSSLYQNHHGNKNGCYFVRKNNSRPFIKKRKCSNEINGLVCEVRSSNATQSGPVSINIGRFGRKITFWIPLFPPQNKSWNEAQKWCKTNNNGTLAILNTVQKQNLIRRFVPAGWGRKFWIGLQSIEGDLQWVDGSPENSSLYQNHHDNENGCYFVRESNSRFFEKRNCSNEINGLVCEVRSSTATQSGIHRPTPSVTQPSEQTSATTDASNPDISPIYTIHHVVMTPSTAVSNIVKATPTTSSSVDIKSETSSMLPTNPSPSSSPPSLPPSPLPTPTSLTPLPLTPPPSPTLHPSISTISSSMQLSQSSSSSSSHQMGTTLDIISTKSRPVQPSTSAMPSKSAVGDKDMMNDFHDFMKTLNTSNPDCMSDLLTNYSGLMKWMDEQDQTDIEEYNPLTDAKDIENIALEFTKQHLSSQRKNMSITNKDIAFHAMLVDADLNSDVIFPKTNENPDTNTISLPKALFKGQETYVVNVVYKNNKTIRQLTPTGMEGRPDDKKTWSVNTGIFSLTIFPKRKQLPEIVNITLHHIQKIKYVKPHCSFWNFSIPTNYSGSWSQQGCHVMSTADMHTVCACNHLTNFAVLMKLNDHEVPSTHKEALLFITYVGLALSLLGETITVLLYCVFLNLRHEKIQIRVNLLCALAAAQIVFLAGIDKAENKILCTCIASLLHLFYLVSFCWMLMEGVYLYRMVVQVFDAHITMRYSYIFAFGFPLCVLAGSLITASTQSEGIYSYVSSEYCWIRFENGFIWSFVVPVLILIAINSFFLFRVLKEMAFMKSVQTIRSLELSSIKASARACVVLLPLLGITWLFGLLSAVTTHVVWQYVFTILNAMQGFMIFVLHCLRNTELKAAMELRYFQWESSHAGVGHRNSTPSKFLFSDESDKSRSNSLPMATKVNQVIPEKQTSKQ